MGWSNGMFNPHIYHIYLQFIKQLKPTAMFLLRWTKQGAEEILLQSRLLISNSLLLTIIFPETCRGRFTVDLFTKGTIIEYMEMEVTEGGYEF